MSSNNQEQKDAFVTVRTCLSGLSGREKKRLLEKAAPYLGFRQAVDLFLTGYFNALCTRTCYESRVSACCSKDGIIVFFADVVINVLVSDDKETTTLIDRLDTSGNGLKCVYLGDQGCLWRIKPIVCRMFLCNTAKKRVFDQHPEAEKKWAALKEQEKRFKWPDRPVLFDLLERYFMDAGYDSPLMYFHHSPGLLRVKRLARLPKTGLL